MSDLVAVCRCGADCKASELHDDLCLPCRVDRAVEPFWPDLQDLVLRRDRYSRVRRINLGPVDRQIGRVEKRIHKAIYRLVPDPNRAGVEFRRSIERFRLRAFPLTTSGGPL